MPGSAGERRDWSRRRARGPGGRGRGPAHGLGELARQLADANVNVELAYTTFGGVKIVIATDDLESARAALR
jgi:hypothetical protein